MENEMKSEVLMLRSKFIDISELFTKTSTALYYFQTDQVLSGGANHMDRAAERNGANQGANRMRLCDVTHLGL
jgi:hypothetical protein